VYFVTLNVAFGPKVDLKCMVQHRFYHIPADYESYFPAVWLYYVALTQLGNTGYL